jgi:hypothetical protein
MNETPLQNVSEAAGTVAGFSWTQLRSRMQISRRALCWFVAALVGIAGFWWVSNSWRYWVAQRMVIDLSHEGKNSGIELPPHRSEFEMNAADRKGLALCTVILPGGRRYTHLVGSLLAGHKDGTTYWARFYFLEDRQPVVIQQLREILQEFNLPTAKFDKWEREYREKGYPPIALYEHSYETNWGSITIRTAPSYSQWYPWTLAVTFSITPEDAFNETHQ